MNHKNKSNNIDTKKNENIPKLKLSFNQNNNIYNYNFCNDLKFIIKDKNQLNINKYNYKKDKTIYNTKNKSIKRNISYNSNKSNHKSKNIIKKSISQNNIINHIKKDKEISKLNYPLKKEKEKEEEKNNFNIKAITNLNTNKYFYKPKNIESNKNMHINNIINFSSPNNKNKYSNKKEVSSNAIKTKKPNKNIFKIGKIQYSNIINNNFKENNELNSRYFNENKNQNICESDNKFFTSLSKLNSKRSIYLNKNDINIIKEEKEIEVEQKKSEEESYSNTSEISLGFLNCDDSHSLCNCSIYNNYKKEKNNNNIYISKVEVKTDTNLEKFKTQYKTKLNKNISNSITYSSKRNMKKLESARSFNKNKHSLQYLKKQILNKSASNKNKHQNRICFIMNDDIITDNKNATLISLGIKSKKNNNNYISIPNLRKFQTNDTEINKIQDILSHGDKTFSELAYDKGVSDVVDKIPSPNSHRGSKDVVPKSIKNPNENYGPFISLFSIGLDRKDESSYSSSPCCSRSNSSSKVIKIITSLRKKNKKCKNIKKILNHYNFIEDEKEKINKNNNIESEAEKEKENINDNNNDEINNDINQIDLYPEPIWSEQDIELSSKLKNDLNNEELINKYNDFITKLSKGVQEKNIKKDFNNNINENKLKEFEDDYNLISQMISDFEKLEENYNNECDKINDKIFRITRSSNFILQQSFPNNHTLQNSISSFSQRLEKIDNQYNKEVKNYKKTIQNLIEQLKIISGDSENGIDKKLLQEIKDIQFSERQIINTFFENKNSSNDKNSQNSEKKELIKELEIFKHEEKEYKFLIPQKYSFDNNKMKLIKNGIIKGLFVKVYENKVIDIINKHGTTKRIFPDGFQISFYNNKDIKLRFTNKNEFCFYHVNQTEEFRFPSKGIIVYKFKNGQFEKHYSNYELNIKFTDGSYRIIRKGIELFQYPDGFLEFKDKKGNKSYMDI